MGTNEEKLINQVFNLGKILNVLEMLMSYFIKKRRYLWGSVAQE